MCLPDTMPSRSGCQMLEKTSGRLQVFQLFTTDTYPLLRDLHSSPSPSFPSCPLSRPHILNAAVFCPIVHSEHRYLNLHKQASALHPASVRTAVEGGIWRPFSRATRSSPSSQCVTCLIRILDSLHSVCTRIETSDSDRDPRIAHPTRCFAQPKPRTELEMRGRGWQAPQAPPEAPRPESDKSRQAKLVPWGLGPWPPQPGIQVR